MPDTSSFNWLKSPSRGSYSWPSLGEYAGSGFLLRQLDNRVAMLSNWLDADHIPSKIVAGNEEITTEGNMEIV